MKSASTGIIAIFAVLFAFWWNADAAVLSPGASGCVIYRAGAYETDDRFVIAEYKTYDDFRTGTVFKTLSGEVLRLTPGHRPIIIPYPSDMEDAGAVGKRVAEAKDRFPHLAMDLSSIERAWLKAQSGGGISQANAPAAVEDAIGTPLRLTTGRVLEAWRISKVVDGKATIAHRDGISVVAIGQLPPGAKEGDDWTNFVARVDRETEPEERREPGMSATPVAASGPPITPSDDGDGPLTFASRPKMIPVAGDPAQPKAEEKAPPATIDRADEGRVDPDAAADKAQQASARRREPCGGGGLAIETGGNQGWLTWFTSRFENVLAGEPVIIFGTSPNEKRYRRHLQATRQLVDMCLSQYDGFQSILDSVAQLENQLFQRGRNFRNMSADQALSELRNMERAMNAISSVSPDAGRARSQIETVIRGIDAFMAAMAQIDDQLNMLGKSAPRLLEERPELKEKHSAIMSSLSAGTSFKAANPGARDALLSLKNEIDGMLDELKGSFWITRLFVGRPKTR